MSIHDDPSDSSDWLKTPLAGFAPLESGLRCQICKDLFSTPMITSCSHTFCSLCIRRYLSQEGRCPACRESDQEMKLRHNWAIEELVEHFRGVRSQILDFARQSAEMKGSDSSRPKKRRKVDVPATSETAGRRSTRIQSRKLAASASQEPISTQEEVADSEDDGSIYDEKSTPKSQKSSMVNGNTEAHDGLVACPCCHRRMKETSINTHLDLCIQGLAKSSTPPPSMTPANVSLAYPQRTKPQTSSKTRLPTINYALTSETSLRKKLKELGIPSQGNKELMRKRHTEWVNIWNADCDSSKPKAKRDLLRELDIWERTLGRQIERGGSSAGTGVMVKDFDREGWVKSQKEEFEDLIKKAKEKRKVSTHPPTGEYEESTRSKEFTTTSVVDDVKMNEASDAFLSPQGETDHQHEALGRGFSGDQDNEQTPPYTGASRHTPKLQNMGSNSANVSTENYQSHVTFGNPPVAPVAPYGITDAPPTSLEPALQSQQCIDLISNSATSGTCSNHTAGTSATTPGTSRSKFFV